MGILNRTSAAPDGGAKERQGTRTDLQHPGPGNQKSARVRDAVGEALGVSDAIAPTPEAPATVEVASPTPPPAPPEPLPEAVDAVALLEAENADLRAQINNRALDDAIAEANRMVKLADPSDVLRYLDRADLCDADGRADVDRVVAAVSRLAAERPYLRARETPRAGSADGRTGSSWPAQLTIADIATMSPEQIDAARRGGLLNRAMGLD